MTNRQSLPTLIDEAISSGRWTRTGLARAVGIHRTQLWRMRQSPPIKRSLAAERLRTILEADKETGLDDALMAAVRRVVRKDANRAKRLLRLLHEIEEW